MRPVGWRYDSARHALAAKGISTRRYSAIIGFNAEDKQRIRSVIDRDPRLKTVLQRSVVNIIPISSGVARWRAGDIELNMRKMRDDEELHATLKHELMHAAHDVKLGPEGGVGSFLGPYEEVRERTIWPEFSGERRPRVEKYVEEYPGSYELLGPYRDVDVDSNLLMPTEVLAYGVEGTRGRAGREEDIQRMLKKLPPEMAWQFEEDVQKMKSDLKVAPSLKTFKTVWEPDNEEYVLWRRGPWKIGRYPEMKWSDPENPFRVRATAEFKRGNLTSDYPILMDMDGGSKAVAWNFPQRIPKYVDVQARRVLEGRIRPKTDEQRSEIAFRKMFASRKSSVSKEELQRWRKNVNMSAGELSTFMKKYGDVAGLSRKEASAEGIKSGRDSARAIIRMKQKPVATWNAGDVAWMRRQNSFVARMRGAKGPLYDDEGRPTRKLLALKVWGHDPEKQR